MYSQGRSKLSIAAQTGVSRNTAKKYMATFESSGLTFDQINALNDKELDEFFGAVKQMPPQDRLVYLQRCFPRIDKELIEKYHEGIIATTCCIGAYVPQAILHKSEAEAEKEFEWLRATFGDRFYAELQENKLAEQTRINEWLLERCGARPTEKSPKKRARLSKGDCDKVFELARDGSCDRDEYSAYQTTLFDQLNAEVFQEANFKAMCERMTKQSVGRKAFGAAVCGE